MRKTQSVFNELEKDYGPWPHPRFIAYIAGSGGMEYAGATMTSLWALGHEMHHSYFARGMGPAMGNAGWIDEALASWRDDGYRRGGSLRKTNMAGKSPYVRQTDRAAYSAGSEFIAYLDKDTFPGGGMKKFLKDFAESNMYKSVTTKSFQSALETYFNKDYTNLFRDYIYGGNTKGRTNKRVHPVDQKEVLKRNLYHPQLTDEQLQQLL